MRSPFAGRTTSKRSPRLGSASRWPAAVLGPAAGHSALAAPMSDFTVMTPAAAIFTAGPPLVKASLGEDVDAASLGGPDVALTSGVIHNGATR